ncbi:YdcF family protein [Nocardia sp. XZ_19_385]|uniref:YdcF family protein n=1 Tax=Nocardia sp. XZ_19_385 TaxID=2769488 RepID=UPI001E4F603A|nr:YdcF family protein [Nocardia sp. XZ_19_385]
MLDSFTLRNHPALCVAAGLAGATAVLLSAPATYAQNSGSAITDPVPSTSTQLGFRGPGTAIVVLGYGLLPDGEMRPELIARLHTGFVQALLAPAAPIIVTGGNPRNGVTEAGAMAGWLVAHGIPADRIHLESDATCTLENAAHSARIMREIGARDAVVVTSADHIDRADGDFTAAGVAVSGTLTPEQIPLLALPFGPA